jgi:hypothetical protein
MYIKFHQVDALTGISIKLQPTIEGPTFPAIDGLELIAPSIDFDLWYATVPDTYKPDKANLIFKITKAELAQELSNKIDILKQNQLTTLYQEEIDLRNSLFSKYHETALLAGIYKYDQAKALVTDGTPSPIIDIEADIRGITSVELANKIIANHEAFRDTSAKLAGLRGKIADRLNGFVFDMNDPIVSSNVFEQQEEVIGTKEENGETKDVEVGFYASSLVTRWEYLGA